MVHFIAFFFWRCRLFIYLSITSIIHNTGKECSFPSLSDVNGAHNRSIQIDVFLTHLLNSLIGRGVKKAKGINKRKLANISLPRQLPLNSFQWAFVCALFACLLFDITFFFIFMSRFIIRERSRTIHLFSSYLCVILLSLRTPWCIL